MKHVVLMRKYNNDLLQKVGDVTLQRCLQPQTTLLSELRLRLSAAATIGMSIAPEGGQGTKEDGRVIGDETITSREVSRLQCRLLTADA